MSRRGFDQAQRTEDVLQAFCKEFIENPYLCYTEHGLTTELYARTSDQITLDEIERIVI